jgi:hypothetical protein
MKVRKLVIEVLYHEDEDDNVTVLLDKMTTDWLTQGVIEEYNKTLSKPYEPVQTEWDYFYEWFD